MTIVYKSGKRHSDADCLSRAPLERNPVESEDDTAFLGALEVTDLARRQRDDPELQPLIEYLEERSSHIPHLFRRSISSFVLRDGVLYKKSFHPTSAPYLLVVPRCIRDDVLYACHDTPSSGHLGFTRTLARVRRRYYWSKFAATVKHYVTTCRECQRRKTPPTRPPGFLQPIDPPNLPFQQVGMDLLGPFPLSSTGNKWIVVATDYLTRYCEAKALPRGTSAEIARFFLHSIVLRHGAPAVVITDRGTAFTSALTEEVMKLTYTDHRRTTAYHPQTNGLTERLNKTIADMISMYVNVEHNNWDDVLPYVVFAYNTAVQETTGFTPFRLVHGREVTTMLDAMLLPNETETLPSDAEEFTRCAEAARHLARCRIRHQQSVDAHRYNQRHKEVVYQCGDQVWIWSPVRLRGRSEKLLRRYFGPYTVVRRLGDVTYQVIPEGTVRSRRRARPEVVHVARMKPYYSR